jgi:hypothetical protein
MKIKMKKTRRTVLDRLWPMVPALLARPQTLNQPAWPMPASTRGAVTVLRVAAAAWVAPPHWRARYSRGGGWSKEQRWRTHMTRRG